MNEPITQLPEVLTTPYDAWITGFRVGVTEALVFDEKLTIDNFKESVADNAFAILSIWHNVGRDSDNGIWCILGARMGTYMTMLTNWDPKLLEDSEAIQEIWKSIESDNAEHIAGMVAEELVAQLDLPIVFLDAGASKFFKQYFSLNAAVL